VRNISGVPDHVPPERVFEVDIFHDPRLAPDPHQGWAELRAEMPDVFYTPLNGGHWVVTRREGILDVLRNTADFTNRYLNIPKSDAPSDLAPLSLDPPEHTPYRQALMGYFSLPAVRRLDEKVRGWTTRLIDQVIEAGECDFVHAIGGVLPVSVFMQLVGLPLDRLWEFRGWVDASFQTADTAERQAIYGRIFGFMNEVIEARAKEPRDDLISQLIATEIDGRPLGVEGARMISVLLFIGGMDTVANAMGFAMRHLAGDAALQDRLFREPEAVSGFVDESLRRYAFTNTNRMVRRDTEALGVPMRAGEMVNLCMILGGIDERAFEDPLRFDSDRDNAADHVTFGGGAHKCVGRHLGRMEMNILFQQLTQRLKSIRLKPGAPPAIRAGHVLSADSLWITFEPR
jgi:cytochrome P450